MAEPSLGDMCGSLDARTIWSFGDVAALRDAIKRARVSDIKKALCQCAMAHLASRRLVRVADDERDESELDALYDSLITDRRDALSVLENTKELPPRQAVLMGHAFFSAERYDRAAAAYDWALNAPIARSATTLLLSVYAYEQHAAKSASFDEAQAAIESAQRQLNVAQESLSSQPELLSELRHCEGHVFLTSARSQLLFGRVESWGHSIRGTGHLGQAAADFRYKSCYTSAWSDLMQFDRTDELSGDSLDALATAVTAFPRTVNGHEGSHAALAETVDQVNVAFEIAFYHAYAKSCLGRFGSAARMFAEIIRHARELRSFPSVRQQAHFFLRSIQETIGHAQVFLAKNELRRVWLQDVPRRGDLDAIERLLNNGRRMLRTRTASPARTETDSVAEVVQFLQLISDVTDGTHAPAGIADHVASAAAVLLTSLGDRYMSSLGNPGHRLVTQVGATELSHFPEGFRRHVATITVDEFLVCDIGLLGDLVVLMPTKSDTSLLTALRRRASDVYPTRPIIMVHPGPKKLTLGAAPYTAITTAAGQATPWMHVCAAVALARRFLVNDRFAFNLAPCVASPALRYQEPQWTLKDTMGNG